MGLYGDPPDPDPMVGEAAKMSAETSKEYLDWYKGVYANEIAPRQQRYDQLTETLIADYLDTNKQNKEMAAEQLARQKALFYPVEEKMVQEAMNYDSPERMERMAGQAAADVNQQFSNTRGQMQRSLGAYGLRPDAGAFAALNTKLSLGQALGAAAAQNKARTDVQDKAIALRAGAANFGRGLGTQAASGFSTSIAANQGAGGQGAQAMSSAMQGYAGMGSAYNTALSGFGQAGNLGYQNSMLGIQSFQAGQAPLNALLGAAGTAAGMYFGKKADGGSADEPPRARGAVRGPGGPVDDKIPAMLSNGEYVLPADTVKAIGKKKLDQIVDKTHTPAAIQRRRAALKKGRK